MAPISDIFRREDSSANSNVAYYLLITSTVLFAAGMTTIISLCIFRRMRRIKKAKRLQAEAQDDQQLLNEKLAFLNEDGYSMRDSAPAIHLTLPEDHITYGNRQSRVVVVTIGDSGSVGYAPYQEPLPVYQQKESSRFHSLDLERIGGLREDTIGRAS